MSKNYNNRRRQTSSKHCGFRCKGHARREKNSFQNLRKVYR